jgi:multicomponent Na+:H+ antiporter subunit G
MMWVALALAALGVVFMVLSAVGVVLMRDTYARLHCAAKSATLGVALTLAAAGLASGDAGVLARCLLGAAFFLATGPIGGHVLARALFRRGR